MPNDERIPAPDEQAVEVPHDMAAEQSLLGCWLKDGRDHENYLRFPVEPQMFYFDEHVRIAEVVHDYVLLGKGTDPILVAAELKSRNNLDAIGGLAYLKKLVELVPSIRNVEYYAEIVKETAIKRNIIRIARDAYEQGFNPSVTASDLQATIAKSLDAIEQPHDVSMVQVVSEAIADQSNEEKSSEHWPKTGISTLDMHIGGFKPGAVTCIAAFPGIGKSSIAGYATYMVAKRMIPDCYISLEMNQQELLNRCLAIEGVAPNNVMNQHRMSQLQLLEYARMGMEIVAPLPMWLIDKQEHHANAILTEIRRQRVIHGCQLFVLDYLQLVQPEGSSQGNYNQFLSWFTAELKNAARMLSCHIIEISQVSRDAFKDDRPLTMHDLRDSGSIEQNADNIILLNKVGTPATPGDPNCLISVEIAKQRSGVNGVSFALTFNQDYQIWSSPLDGTPMPEPPARKASRRVRKPDSGTDEAVFN